MKYNLSMYDAYDMQPMDIQVSYLTVYYIQNKLIKSTQFFSINI